MSNVPTLIDSCIGMDDIAQTVTAMPRDDLERLAGNAIALARLNAERDFGSYSRRMIANGISKLVSSIAPLDEQTLKLVKTSL